MPCRPNEHLANRRPCNTLLQRQRKAGRAGDCCDQVDPSGRLCGLSGKVDKHHASWDHTHEKGERVAGVQVGIRRFQQECVLGLREVGDETRLHRSLHDGSLRATKGGVERPDVNARVALQRRCSRLSSQESTAVCPRTCRASRENGNHRAIRLRTSPWVTLSTPKLPSEKKSFHTEHDHHGGLLVLPIFWRTRPDVRWLPCRSIFFQLSAREPGAIIYHLFE